jgi:hypothetical protein
MPIAIVVEEEVVDAMVGVVGEVKLSTFFTMIDTYFADKSR